MRWKEFAGSLLFAVFAALLLPIAAPFIAPLVGNARGVGLLWIGLGGLYGLAWVNGRGRRFAAGSAWLLILFAAPAMSSSPFYGIALTSLLLAFMRAGVSLRVWTLRRVAAELAIAGSSLVWVHSFLAPWPSALGVSVWGYFLLQSAYPLCQKWVEEPSRPSGLDPFDRARARLLSILDEGG